MVNQELVKIICDRVTTSPQRKITFAEYMDLVLYHPEQGYYSAGIVEIGKDGDFFTSASLGADFGELLAEQFVEIWQILDKPKPFHLVEMGAGQGILAQDILNYFQQKYPEILDNLEYIIVEQAPALIARQKQVLQHFSENNIKISWKSLDEIADNSVVGCCFSNELIDAFPVHQIVIQEQQLREIYITYSEDAGLTEIIAEPSTPKLNTYFNNLEIDFVNNTYPEDYRSEVNLQALDWLKTISNKLKTGYLITIDYGYVAQKYYHPQRYQGTLQCYYQHRHHSNPYLNIGYQDITAHVNFTALEQQGQTCGLNKIGFTQQGMLLMALGLSDRLQELATDKFKIQEIFQRRDALHQLINPSGLGGFGVLIQSKGLTQLQQNYILKGLTQPT